MATRKKYKIVLSEKYVRKSDNGKEWFQFPVDVSGQLVAIQTIIPLDPYTEPDLEQVKKEAYDKGYDDAKGGYENGFENGMIVAWDAATKILKANWGERNGMFGAVTLLEDIFLDNTPAEAIEKIRQYEQRQEEQIQVGDEVELKCGVRPATYMQGTKGSDEIYLLFNDGSCGLHSKSEIERKTGRHFPEIAAVLEKMREGQDG